MSEISEIEIKSMTKEQNYMRGYEDGRSDVLDKIRAEINSMTCAITSMREMYVNRDKVISIIDKYKVEREEEELYDR